MCGLLGPSAGPTLWTQTVVLPAWQVAPLETPGVPATIIDVGPLKPLAGGHRPQVTCLSKRSSARGLGFPLAPSAGCSSAAQECRRLEWKPSQRGGGHALGDSPHPPRPVVRLRSQPVASMERTLKRDLCLLCRPPVPPPGTERVRRRGQGGVGSPRSSSVQHPKQHPGVFSEAEPGCQCLFIFP